MNENIYDYKRSGYIDLDAYLANNPACRMFPNYLDGFDSTNFWTVIRKEDKDTYMYVKPREYDTPEGEYNAYTEMVYAELLKQVGLKTAEYDLAMYDGSYATMSDNLLNEYSKDQFLVTGEDLLASRPFIAGDIPNIEDLYDSIYRYCDAECIDNQVAYDCVLDIQKQCIADIFTLSTKRDAIDFDFIAGLNKDRKESIEVAPSCHNTYALGSNFDIEELEDMILNPEILDDRCDLCYTDSGIPDFKRNYTYPQWQDALYYLVDEDESNFEFAQKCVTDMNLDKAIYNVEEKLDAPIPEEFKYFMHVLMDQRLKDICRSLDISYDVISRNKKENIEEVAR